MAAVTKTKCILDYLKSGDESQKPTAAELMELKKSMTADEWYELYDGLPAEFKVATE